MPAPVTVAAILERSGALLNAGDVSDPLNVFTYDNQMPYLNIALDELAQIMQSNNVSMTNETSQYVIVPVGTTTLTLPADLIDIQALHERQQGTLEDFQLMTRCEFLPPFVEQTGALVYFTWQGQAVNFIGASLPREVRIDYVGQVLTSVTDKTQTISVINAMNFLAYRTAALCAHFVGENEDRASALNQNAQTAMDLFLNINTKGRQAIPIRRRPFMASYKIRQGF